MGALRVCFGLLLIASASWSQYLISTVAGGAPPPTPAPGLTVSIGKPQGTATDTAGNLYFTSLNCVFKLDLNGIVTRIAGTSRAGYSGDGGSATLAQLNGPNGVAVDSAGNVFVAEVGNRRVRKILNGIITTVAGSGIYGFSGDGGPAVKAQMEFPAGIAVDGRGNLFIVDSGTNRVRMVSATGIMSTVAGNGTAGFSGDGGPAVSAELSQPQYLAVDRQGDLFIADTGNNVVREVSASGNISTLAGTGTAGYSGDVGPAASAQLQGPQGVAVDQLGDVFIVDSSNYRVRKVSPTGVITTVVGNGGNGATGDGGPATSATINGSYGVSVDAAGNIFLASYYAIREVSNGVINTVAGTGALYSGDNGAAPSAQFNAPAGVAVDGSGNLFIADGNNRLRRVAANGIVTTIAGNGACCGGVSSGVSALGPNVSPDSVAVDTAGDIFITDFFGAVRKVSANGIITTVAGIGLSGLSGDGGPATNAQIANSPGGVAVDTSGNIYFADTGNNLVRKVSTSGTISTVAGTGTAGSSGDGGQATAAQLSQPNGVAVDAAGNLYIADAGNNRIRKVTFAADTPGGIIITVAGSAAGGAFAGDGGPATSAQLQNPEGVAVDAQGNIFIADTYNHRVRKVDLNGTITSVAGTSPGYSGDCGPATSAQVFSPSDVVIDASGNIFIADTSNNAIRRLQPASKSTLVCSVADAASEGQGPVSPGKIVVIYGTGLGSSPISYTAPVNGIFGTQLAGTSVAVNGVAAPLIYTLPGQVSAIVPYETTGSAAQFAVSYQGQTATYAVPVAAAAPSLFTANSSGVGQAAAINNVDGSYNSASDPVAIGGYVQLYATGEGQTSPAGVDGAVALTQPFPMPVLQPVTATVGSLPAVVEYAGAAPGSVAGLMQVNVRIPAGVQPGSQVPVVVHVGTASTGVGVTIAVAGN